MLWLKNKFLLSDGGTINLFLAVIACLFQNFALILPVGLIYSLIMLLSVINIGGFNMSDSRAVFYLGAAFICALLIFASSWFQYNMTFSASSKESNFRRLTLLERLRKISLSFFSDNPPKDLAAQIMKDCESFENKESRFTAPFAGALIFIVFMSLPLIYINWRLALAALWVVPVALILARVNEFFAVCACQVLKFGVVSTVFAGALLYDSLRMSDFILFILTVLRMYEPLINVIALKNEHKPADEILTQPLQTGSEILTNKNFTLEFQNVSYKNLQNISFTAKQGEITILTGENNFTALQLILRFWDVTQGAIRIGGENINQFDPEKLMSLFAVISRDSQLINYSVQENIKLGRKNAADKDVIKAAKLADCENLLSRPRENLSLSESERQKIFLARAILKDAPIVLLDENAISLDNNSINSLIHNKTVIIIARQNSTIAGTLAYKEVNLQ